MPSGQNITHTLCVFSGLRQHVCIRLQPSAGARLHEVERGGMQESFKVILFPKLHTRRRGKWTEVVRQRRARRDVVAVEKTKCVS